MAKSLFVHLFLLILHIDHHYAYLNDTLGLSFNLRKNQTGHMVTKWSITKGSPKIPQNMNIDVSTQVNEIGGIQFFNLKGLISVPPPKPIGYELFPGVGYYKFYPDGASSFNEASSICSKDGGHLAIVNSEAEASVLVAIYSRYPKAKDWAWVGFHDMDVEGKYVTIFGEPLANTGFIKWHRGQPDNGDGNEDCGSIHKTAGDLNDLWCDKRVPWPFFCEYDLSWL